MKINNKTLGIAFGILLLIYFLTKLVGGNKERSFDPQILSIDTSQVTKINVEPANNATPFSLEKTGSGWSLMVDDKQFSATSSSVSGLLGNLQNVKAERVVSKNPARYQDYSVDDTTGTRIELHAGSKKLGDVMVGRFNFNQATRSGISYLRLTEEEPVYSVDGFLSMSLSQGSDNYRDKSITSINSEDVTRITLADGSNARSYSSVGTDWQDEAGNAIDSAKMVSYLNNIRTVSGVDFVVDPAAQMGAKINTLTIEGNNMDQPVEVNVYASQDTTHHFVVHSSTNQEGYFFSDSSAIYKRLITSFEDPRSTDE